MPAPFRCIIAAASGLLALAGALTPSVASAAPTPVSSPRDPDAFSLTVSPTRLTIGPGDIGSTQQITLVNRGRAPLDVAVQKRHVDVAADGSVRYQHDGPDAASSWVAVSPEQILIEPGKTQVVSATVTAPRAYEPGDHQLALVFMVPPGKADGNVRVNRGVGLPISITAPAGSVPNTATAPSVRVGVLPWPWLAAGLGAVLLLVVLVLLVRAGRRHHQVTVTSAAAATSVHVGAADV